MPVMLLSFRHFFRCRGIRLARSKLGFPSRPMIHRALPRSEEHTSELQSQSNLVCRLLLEKKKKSHMPTSAIPATTTTISNPSLPPTRHTPAYRRTRCPACPIRLHFFTYFCLRSALRCVS